LVLKAYWPLNENSGSTAYDHSLNENHGTINGAEAGAGASFLEGNTMSFDRSNNDEVDTGLRTISRPFSISCWIRPSDTNRGEFFGNRDSGGSYDTYLGHSNDSSGEVYFALDQGSNVSTSGGLVSASSWHHIVAVSSPDAMIIYVDGFKRASGGSGSDAGDSGAPHLIGNRPDDPSFAFDGDIAEFRIYSRKLTPQEVQYLYNVSKRGRQVSSGKSS
jgi:hypothetical protein